MTAQVARKRKARVGSSVPIVGGYGGLERVGGVWSWDPGLILGFVDFVRLRIGDLRRTNRDDAAKPDPPSPEAVLSK